MGVSTRRGERRVEECVAVSVADFRRRRGVIDRVHGQGQGNHAVAALDGLQRVVVSTRRGERRVEECVVVAIADFRCRRGVIDGVHGQGQGNHAVATLDGLQRVVVSARRCERLPEEVVAVAVADFRRHWSVINGIHD